MKKLLLTLALAIGLTTAAYSQTVVSGAVAAGCYQLASYPVDVNAVTLIATNVSAVVRFYSAWDTNLVWTNAAYTNYTTYLTNIVNSYITTTGLTNAWTNQMLYAGTTVVAANTNNAETPVMTYAVAANTVVSFADRFSTLKTLCMSNNNTINYIVTFTRR